MTHVPHARGAGRRRRATAAAAAAFGALGIAAPPGASAADAPPVTASTTGAPRLTIGPLGITLGPEATPAAPTTPTPTPPAAATGATPVVVRLPARVALPRTAPVAGTVRTADGAPAGGVVLRVASGAIGDRSSGFVVSGTTSSAADGTFTVPGGGQSRTVRVSIADPDHTGEAAETTLVQRRRVTIAAPKRVLRNGSRLTLRGRVAGTGRAASGLPVLVQSRLSGGWRTVDSVTARSGGAVSWRYRFERTRRSVSFRFRFVVPTVRGLPWSRTTSRSALVRVRPAARS